MHPKPILAVASTLLLAPTLAAGLYNKNSPVLQLNTKDFDANINRSNHTSIVEFYAPWCGHCQSLAPAFEKAAKKLSGLAKVAAVNCDEEANKPLCGSMGVQGFPTLKIVRPGKKAGKPTVEDYQGARSAKAIVDAVVDKIPNHVARLKDADLESWSGKSGPRAILFSDKGVVSALLKALAIDFLGGIDVAQVRNKETQAVEKFDIKKFPTLVLLPGDGKDPVKYDGEMKKEPMVAFLSQAVAPNPDPAPKKAKSSSTGKKEKSKSSKASSSFSKASASHASSEGSASPASQTAETLEEASNPTASPDPKVEPEHTPVPIPVAPPISSLPDGLSLQQKCLNDKASTCILALLPANDESTADSSQAIVALSEIHHKHESAKRKLFPFYQLPASNSQATALRKLLSLSNGIELIAVNGKRGWYRHLDASSTGLTASTIESWIDAIRMDDLPKTKIPENIIVPRDALPAEPVKYEPVTDDPVSMKEQLKNQMPEGVDFEFEEIDDDEYDRIMKESKAKEEKKVEAEVENEHDEL
jgi:protein disulfide-isomerase A6